MKFKDIPINSKCRLITYRKYRGYRIYTVTKFVDSYECEVEGGLLHFLPSSIQTGDEIEILPIDYSI
jgi:hypothetical protein